MIYLNINQKSTNYNQNQNKIKIDAGVIIQYSQQNSVNKHYVSLRTKCKDCKPGLKPISSFKLSMTLFDWIPPLIVSAISSLILEYSGFLLKKGCSRYTEGSCHSQATISEGWCDMALDFGRSKDFTVVQGTPRDRVYDGSSRDPE